MGRVPNAAVASASAEWFAGVRLADAADALARCPGSTGVTGHFDGEDKAAWVAEVCERHGIQLSEAVAVGDSRSDLPRRRDERRR